MKDYLEKQPRFPELMGCKAGGGGDYCAQTGCFYENVKKRIDPSTVGIEKAEEMKKQADENAHAAGCKKYNL